MGVYWVSVRLGAAGKCGVNVRNSAELKNVLSAHNDKPLQKNAQIYKVSVLIFVDHKVELQSETLLKVSRAMQSRIEDNPPNDSARTSLTYTLKAIKKSIET